jgi:Domain of unknown function (DUF2431)
VSEKTRGYDGQNCDMENNKSLIRQFVKGIVAEEWIEPRRGEIHITHKTKPPFNQWSIVDLVAGSSPQLSYLGRLVFDRCLLQPYIPRKALDRKSFPLHDACVYVFGMSSSAEWMQPKSSSVIQVTPALISKLRLLLLQSSVNEVKTKRPGDGAIIKNYETGRQVKRR